MATDLQEGDEITIGDVIGLLPDGRFLIHHGAPQDHLAVWKAGASTITAGAEAMSMILVRQGKKPSGRPTPHFMGCGCDGYRNET